MAHDLGGTLTHWTAGCERLYGWAAHEAVGQNVHDLLRTRFSTSLRDIHDQLRQRGSWEGELTHWHKDGHPLQVASRWVSLSPPDGGEAAVLQADHDVSDLKEAQGHVSAREAHLRSILETVPEAMVVIDAAGIVTSFSTAAQQLFGYTEDEIRGQNVRILMPSPDRDAHDGYISRYIRTGERRIIGYGRVVTARRKDGTTFQMELSIGEAIASGQRIFTGFIRDLTTHHKMEEELRQAQKMEAIGQLTGGIAHDFNNLLTVISGNLEMIESRLSDERLRPLLREAQDAADDGAKLTAQLLAFGRRQPLNARPADIGALVSTFTDLMRRTLGEMTELQTIVTGSAHRALVDASQLQNALLNLALNARDAMPRGGKLVLEISSVDLDRDYAQMYPDVRTGRYVLIAVTDTGSGMTPEVRSRAFEPFYTTKEVGAGTGLGLSMVYGFAKQSGGHVQLYSEVGQGTTVRLFLPALQEPDAAVLPVRDGAPGRDDILRGTETILVVEDDPRVRRIAVARLQDAGYVVIEAATAAEGLARIEEHPEIDLLFTDIIIPGGMTGDELARAVRVRHPDIKILFTSGYAEPSIAGRELAETGSWLKKPYTARELATRLRELLG